MKIDWSKLTPAQLAEVKLQIDAADAKKGWPVFRGVSKAIQTDIRHEVMLAGPADCSKTWGLLWDLDTKLRETPNAHAAMVRKVRADMSASMIKTWEKLSAIRGAPKLAGGLHAEWYDYPNGARVYAYGLDRHSKALGAEFDFIAVSQCEELSHEEWAMLSSRASGRGAVTKNPQIRGDCNPGPPSHWIINRPELNVLYASHTENPELYDDSGNILPEGIKRLAKLDALPGVMKERLRYGRWVSAEGVVYPGFSRDLHCFTPGQDGHPETIPQHARRFRAIDFGYNVFACLWGWIDRDERLRIYRQLYRSKMRLDEHIREILRLSGDENYEFTVGDSADPEALDVLTHSGIPAIPARKGPDSVLAGIQLVSARLAKDGTGVPRLFVQNGSLVERDAELSSEHRPTSLIEEFEVYSWKKNPSGATLDEPEKKNDHACLDGDTLISTRRGHVALRDVVVGDEALTRDGYRPVAISAMTDPAAELWAATFSNGTVLTGTANHPIFVIGKGFTRLDALRYGDSIHAWQPANSSSSTGSNSEGIQARFTSRVGGTSLRVLRTARTAFRAFIRKYGKQLTAQSRLVTMFTTLTKTLPITMSRIWSAFLNLNTTLTIGTAYLIRNVSVEPPYSAATLMRRSGAPLSGTEVQQAESSRLGMQRYFGPRYMPANAAASNAESHICLGRSRPSDSAPTLANRHGVAAPGWTTSSEPAEDAGRRSTSTGTLNNACVPVHVLGVGAVGRSGGVYNLSVDGPAEYFANGILVKNCDALRYAVLHVDRWRSLAEESAVMPAEPWAFDYERPFVANRVFSRHGRVFGRR